MTAALWAGLLALAGTVRGEADRDRFLRAHPAAKAIEWTAPGEQSYLILHDVDRRGDLTAEQAIAVFDGQGRRLYDRRARNDREGLEWRKPILELGAPKVLALPGRVVAFTAFQGGPDKTSWRHIVLVGFKERRAREIEIDYLCSSSYPMDYQYRTWLEDVDGDGNPEVCQFFRGRLECLRWDAANGEWQRLEALSGKRVGTSQEPIRWRLTPSLDLGRRSVELSLTIASLVEQPLALSQPLEPLFPWDLGPTRDAPFSPVALEASLWNAQQGMARCSVSTKGDGEPSLSITPLGTQRICYQVALPRAPGPEDHLEVRLIGRARWACFEANYATPCAIPLCPPEQRTWRVSREPVEYQHRLGAISQDEVDRIYKERVPEGRGIDPAGVSRAFQLWLLQWVASSGEFHLLHWDPSAEMGHLAAEMARVSQRRDPRQTKELLLVALRRSAPSEYRMVLREAGGPSVGLDAALVLLLRDPHSRGDWRLRHTYLDMKTLAAELASWPDPQVAAVARAVLRSPSSEPWRVRGLTEPLRGE